ncbi:MAG: dienelactone hydrolase family protein [Acidimicrobiales bacterium]
MEHHTQYLAEEIAENCVDGLLSRREAMRRLAFLGVSGAAATTLLVGCGDDDDDGTVGAQGATTTAAAGAQQTTTPPVTAGGVVAQQDITYPGDGITVRGAYAGPTGTARGAVLVIHENMGLTPFVRTMVGRLAGSGYAALGVDLLSEQGGTAAQTDPGRIGGLLNDNATSGRNVKDMKSSLQELQRRAPNAKLGAIGFCFGGSMTWELLKAGDPPPLAAAVPFYGSIAAPDFTKTKAAVLAVYAETDSRINANKDLAVGALQSARLTNENRTFPGVGHGFVRFIDEPANASYSQATAAYAAMLDWFGRYLR